MYEMQRTIDSVVLGAAGALIALAATKLWLAPIPVQRGGVGKLTKKARAEVRREARRVAAITAATTAVEFATEVMRDDELKRRLADGGK